MPMFSIVIALCMNRLTFLKSYSIINNIHRLCPFNGILYIIRFDFHGYDGIYIQNQHYTFSSITN